MFLEMAGGNVETAVEIFLSSQGLTPARAAWQKEVLAKLQGEMIP